MKAIKFFSFVMLAILAGGQARAESPELFKASARTFDVPDLRQIQAQVPRYSAVPRTVAAASSQGSVTWIEIPGGAYTLGSDTGPKNARPAHQVSIKTFHMAKTLVTVAQYAECVAQGACSAPGTGGWCNWGKPGRELHPVNCIAWVQAAQYAAFAAARLPTEAEWEYAARSAGKNQAYPWGDQEPTCDLAVAGSKHSYGCDGNGTMPVCSKPLGNTAQGLCDMAGEVNEALQDVYHDSYAGAPMDGSAWKTPSNTGETPAHSIRGGSFYPDAPELRTDYRGSMPDGFYVDTLGMRLAKD